MAIVGVLGEECGMWMRYAGRVRVNLLYKQVGLHKTTLSQCLSMSEPVLSISLQSSPDLELAAYPVFR